MYFSIESCTVISMSGHRNSKNAQICLFCQNCSVSAEVLFKWGSTRNVLSEYAIKSVCVEKNVPPDQGISEYPFKVFDSSAESSWFNSQLNPKNCFHRCSFHYCIWPWNRCSGKTSRSDKMRVTPDCLYNASIDIIAVDNIGMCLAVWLNWY